MRAVRSCLLAVAAILVLAAGTAVGQEPAAESAPAEEARQEPPRGLTTDEIRRFIDTLENEEQRTRFIEDLRVLAGVAEETGTAPPAETLFARVTTQVSDRFSSIFEQIGALGAALGSLERGWAWVGGGLSDPDVLAGWVEAFVAAVIAFGIGYAAFRMVGSLTGRRRRRGEEARPEEWWGRLGSLLLLALIDGLRLAAFAVTTYVLVGALPQPPAVRLVLTGLINVVVVVGVVRILGRLVLAPQGPGIRLLPLGSTAASQIYAWLNRFVVLAILAYFVAHAARFLGMPPRAADGLLTLVWLVIAFLALLFVLQLRETVAELIRGPRGASGPVASARRYLAAVWHVVAFLYIAVLFGAEVLQVEGAFGFTLRATLLTLATVLLAALVVFALSRLLERAFQRQADEPGGIATERRGARHVPAMRRAVIAVVTLLAILVILEAWGLGGLSWLREPTGQRVLGALASISFVLILALVAWQVVSGLITRALTPRDADGNLVEPNARQRTLLPLLRNAFLVVLATVLILMVLSELGVNIAPLLAGAGVVGLAIGFGAQKLVQDVITGFFILVEDTMQVGDVVNLGSNSGLVEGMSIRSVRLRDLTGTVHTVPYSQVSAVMNLTKDFSFYVFEIGIAYRENVDQVIEVVRQLGAELQEDPDFGSLILEPIEILGVDAFADSAVVVKARFKTLPIKQWAVGREFNRRMKARFDELGIEIPFPHVTLYFGEDKQGQAPAANIRVTASEIGRTIAAAEEKAPQLPEPEGEAETSPQRGDDTPVSDPGHSGT